MPIKMTRIGNNLHVEGYVESEEDLRVLTTEEFIHFLNFIIHENVQEKDLKQFYKVLTVCFMTRALEIAEGENDQLSARKHLLFAIQQFIENLQGRTCH